jgi:hypothetical protein
MRAAAAFEPCPKRPSELKRYCTTVLPPDRSGLFGLGRRMNGDRSGDHMLDSDQERWLTYAEAGRLLGISTQAARMLAKRRGWTRRTPNAYGDRALVLVPADAIVHARSPSLDVRMEDAISGERGEPNGHDQVNVRPLESAVEVLREQLGIVNRQVNDERVRADRAEQRADDERKRADEERARADRERDRADRAERRITELQAPRRWWQWRRRASESAP